MGIHLNKVTILIELRAFFLVLVLLRISTSENLPANFVFGDSLVDVGNNNYILSLTKANFLPFGIDFGRPTGRFTNGRTIVDIIGQELGFGLTPPYLALTTVGPVILKGVNYASGGGGILNLTGHVLRLFNLGARKIVVVNVGPIGCIPNQRDANLAEGDSCVTFPNQLANLFNTQLKSLVAELNSNLAGSMFVYADIYHILEDILINYAAFGFENPSSACCNMAGKFGGLIPCGPTSKVCWDRSKYVFWDPYHPTDAANVAIAKRLLDGGSADITPMNIRQLFQSS
ncbi:GDSL esterase/lipase At4g16230-like isoform X2 [Vicia villosa]|uniref:GDSL esterase/lipase At4g16230-like isoform X2 n=1 Tax=Vicia villosa TaxID=3911 RepID=UPI00273BCD9F|nr:GDSL esterase/lipase At4g16230-like isoform X2 [Vicia villosa]